MGMLPRSPFRGCTLIILGGFGISGHIKLCGNCDGKPHLSSHSSTRSCPEFKGPRLNRCHAVPTVPTAVAMVVMSSLTGWANSWSPRHVSTNDRLSLKTGSFLRTMYLLLFPRSVVPRYVLDFQVRSCPAYCFIEETAACSSPIPTFSGATAMPTTRR